MSAPNADANTLRIDSIVIVYLVAASVFAFLLASNVVFVAVLYRRSYSTASRTVSRYGFLLVLLLFVLTQGYLIMTTVAAANNAAEAIIDLGTCRYATYTAAMFVLARLFATLMGMHKQMRKILLYGLIYVYATLTVAVGVGEESFVICLLSYGSAMIAFNALSFIIFRWTHWWRASRSVIVAIAVLYACVISHFMIWLCSVLYYRLYYHRRWQVDDDGGGGAVETTTTTTTTKSKSLEVATGVIYLVVDLIMFVVEPVFLLYVSWRRIADAEASANGDGLVWTPPPASSSGSTPASMTAFSRSSSTMSGLSLASSHQRAASTHAIEMHSIDSSTSATNNNNNNNHHPQHQEGALILTDGEDLDSYITETRADGVNYDDDSSAMDFCPTSVKNLQSRRQARPPPSLAQIATVAADDRTYG